MRRGTIQILDGTRGKLRAAALVQLASTLDVLRLLPAVETPEPMTSDTLVLEG
jgi:hypothetical protein